MSVSYNQVSCAAAQVRTALRSLNGVRSEFNAEKTMLDRVIDGLVSLDRDMEVLCRLFYLKRQECIDCAKATQAAQTCDPLGCH